MKFYIISFIFHVIIITSAFHFTTSQVVDSKNIVVYLNDLNLEPSGGGQKLIQQPIASSSNPPSVIKEEKKQEEKKPKKEVVKKEKLEKKVVKKVNAPKKAIKPKKVKEIVEENNESSNSSSTNENLPVDYFAGMERDGNGSYIGDSKGIGGFGYKIIREVDPKYPMIAKKMGYRKEVVVKTKFLVGLNGKVEKIEFLDDFNSYGFHNEVEKALNKWEFAPIVYHGKNIKMYFYKDFRFNVKG